MNHNLQPGNRLIRDTRAERAQRAANWRRDLTVVAVTAGLTIVTLLIVAWLTGLLQLGTNLGQTSQPTPTIAPTP